VLVRNPATAYGGNVDVIVAKSSMFVVLVFAPERPRAVGRARQYNVARKMQHLLTSVEFTKIEQKRKD